MKTNTKRTKRQVATKPTLEVADPVERVINSRGLEYGDPLPCMTNIGRAWGATLSQHLGHDVPDIAPHIVTLMMAQLKAIRAANSMSPSVDTLLDGEAYFRLTGHVSLDHETPVLPKR